MDGWRFGKGYEDELHSLRPPKIRSLRRRETAWRPEGSREDASAPKTNAVRIDALRKPHVLLH
jgi:hypothetical protein